MSDYQRELHLDLWRNWGSVKNRIVLWMSQSAMSETQQDGIWYEYSITGTQTFNKSFPALGNNQWK